jgi:hypothetical protein
MAPIAAHSAGFGQRRGLEGAAVRVVVKLTGITLPLEMFWIVSSLWDLKLLSPRLVKAVNEMWLQTIGPLMILNGASEKQFVTPHVSN